MTPRLFQRLLGAEFYHLAPEVKAVHERQGQFVYQGRCEVRRGSNPLAVVAARLARLPPTMEDAALEVAFDCQAPAETWQRRFNGVPMRSRMRFDEDRLAERMGPGRFRFRLCRIDKDLHWVAEAARLLGVLPLPIRWLDGVRCRAYAERERYQFEVDARLPLFGRILHYRGWLEPAEDVEAAASTLT